jgi:hypothetical protein
MAGDIDDPSLATAADWLRQAARTQIVSCAEFASAGVSPAAVVLFQSRPGQFGQQHLEQLRRLAPRAKFAVLEGPWCEGERRAGRPSEDAIRLYWHQWQARLPALLATRRQSPGTLAPTDMVLQTLKPGLVKPGLRRRRSGRAGICTTSRESYSALADACTIAGLQTAWHEPDSSPSAVAADVLILDGWESVSRASRASMGNSILLLDWPRPEDSKHAESQGISRVIAKPVLLTDLVAALDALLARLALSLPSQSAA